MIDDQMASNKFGPITRWAGPSFGEYIGTQEQVVTYQSSQGQAQQRANLQGMNQQFENTMLARMYYHDGQQLSHYRLVHETRSDTTILSLARRTQGGTRAVAINRRFTGRLANLLQRPDIGAYDIRRESTVKTFERVEGATIEGSVNTSNATSVTAMVQLNGTHDQRQFTYYQTVQTDENGDFTMTVPYPTEETLGTEDGYTNSSVRAVSNYTVFTGSLEGVDAEQIGGRQLLQNLEQPAEVGNADVSEEAIHEGGNVSVEMESFDENFDVNETDGNQSEEDQTADNETTDDGNTSSGGNDTEGGNETSAALYPAPARIAPA
jgi:dolichyl-diphosphooligosaccharide--protein glycosyltransferase